MRSTAQTVVLSALAVLCVACAQPARLSAQAEPAAGPEPGDRVRVTTTSGDTIRGLFVETGTDGLVLESEGSARHVLSRDRLARVEVGRSQGSRYAGTGALVGGIGTGVTVAVLASKLCSGSTDCSGEAYAAAAILSLLGAGAGALVGAAIGSQVVRWDAVGEAEPEVSFVPGFRDRGRVELSVRLRR